jgi:hypothetical protein
MKFKLINKIYFTLVILFSMILFGCTKYDYSNFGDDDYLGTNCSIFPQSSSEYQECTNQMRDTGRFF